MSPFVSMVVLACAIFAAPLLCADETAQSAGTVVRGIIKDQSGAAIGGAEVRVRAAGFAAVQRTNGEGRFVLRNVPAGAAVISADAAGFAPAERNVVIAAADGDAVELVLGPARVSQHTVVVATRTKALAGDVGATVRTVTGDQLQSTAALTLDNVLGQVPGFNLFRRSSSRNANPTTQGVSLRGTGGSGASRAVVLDDGVPLEDPFGGWVYWSRVPREAVGRVEVVEGGISDLYGSNGLGGAISIVRQPMRESSLRVETSYGNERTPDTSVAGSLRVGQWVGSATGEIFATNGFVIVPSDERGAVDVPADSEHRTGEATVERVLGNDSRVFVRGAVFGENRGNGTPVQINSTAFRQFVAGADLQSERAGNFNVRVYGDAERFSQTFSSIAADRNSESLTNSQFVPATEAGGSVQWSRAVSTRQLVVAGVDAHDVRGDTRELVFVNGAAARATDAGGHQRDEGVFVEDMVRVGSRLFMTAAARYDAWRNFDPVSRSTALATGVTTFAPVRAQSEGAFSPRVGLNYKVTERVSVSASGYRAFRGPTLNELYRSFRVGNVVTQANDQLRAERANGFEAGAAVNAVDQRLVVRGTVFWTEINRPVSNLTLTTTPTLITRHRQNLGRVTAPGFEVESELRVTRKISTTVGYQFVNATVASFPADPTLVGLLVPQVPRQQFTFQTSYVSHAWTVAVQGRAVGVQFDDDRNTLPLGSFFALDGFVSRQMGHGLQVFGAIENALDQRYPVARTPILTVGPPAMVRAGIRLTVGKF